MIRRELDTLKATLSFHTRIPVSSLIDHLNNSIRYFPLIGWFTGFVSFAVLFASGYLFNPSISILFSMLASVLLTGALHEDGFADVCDGFGGGWTKEKILTIMKDSRIGTYGMIGLAGILAFKFLALQQITAERQQPLILALIFITAHTLSRFTASLMTFTYPYVRSAESKSETAVQGSKSNLYIAFVLSAIPLVLLMFFSENWRWLYIIIPLGVNYVSFSRYFYKWIGGYTGDCLGAIQQMSEVIIYLFSILLWKFT